MLHPSHVYGPQVLRTSPMAAPINYDAVWNNCLTRNQINNAGLLNDLRAMVTAIPALAIAIPNSAALTKKPLVDALWAWRQANPPAPMLLAALGPPPFLGPLLISAGLCVMSTVILPIAVIPIGLPAAQLDVLARFTTTPRANVVVGDFVCASATTPLPPAGLTMATLPAHPLLALFRITSTTFQGAILGIEFIAVVAFDGSDAVIPSAPFLAAAGACADPTLPFVAHNPPLSLLTCTPLYLSLLAPQLAIAKAARDQAQALLALPGAMQAAAAAQAPAAPNANPAPDLGAVIRHAARESAAVREKHVAFLITQGVYIDQETFNNICYPTFVASPANPYPEASDLTIPMTIKRTREAMAPWLPIGHVLAVASVTDEIAKAFLFLQFRSHQNTSPTESKHMCSIAHFMPFRVAFLSLQSRAFTEVQTILTPTFTNFEATCARVFGAFVATAASNMSASVSALLNNSEDLDLYATSNVFELVDEQVAALGRLVSTGGLDPIRYTPQERELLIRDTLTISPANPYINSYIVRLRKSRLAETIAAHVATAHSTQSRTDQTAAKRLRQPMPKPQPTPPANKKIKATPGTPQPITATPTPAPVRIQYLYDRSNIPKLIGREPCYAWLNSYNACANSLTCHALNRHGQPANNPHAFDPANTLKQQENFRKWAKKT